MSVGETPLFLEVEDEGPDFVPSDLTHIGADAFREEEIAEVAGTVGNNGGSIGAFPLGSGTELVTMK